MLITPREEEYPPEDEALYYFCDGQVEEEEPDYDSFEYQELCKGYALGYVSAEEIWEKYPDAELPGEFMGLSLR
jgi:hypothetical protein